MTRKNTEQAQYIAIDGPIGVGKTTLVKHLAQEMGGTALLESEELNPFLGEFYKDRKRNAFKTQLFFLLNRYQQQQELRKQETLQLPIVCDYTFTKDKIFANINLSEAESELYFNVYNLLDKQLFMKPDIVVYLRAQPDVVLKRIRNRGFDFERPIDENYIENLMNAYNAFYLNYTDTPLLVIDTTHTDFLHDPQTYELLKKEILTHRQGTKQLILR